MMFFICPAAVSWERKNKTGVEFGFCQGYKIQAKLASQSE
jgi:hypothetical protein